MKHDRVFYSLNHTLNPRNRMWIESHEVIVKRAAKKMPLALAKAGVMVCIASLKDAGV
jgi:hypothetical protein